MKYLVPSERRQQGNDVLQCAVLGLLQESYDKIFGLFQRLHTAEKYPGTGVGLAVVRKGAERMGGNSGLESQPGQGSRFWFELPTASSMPNG